MNARGDVCSGVRTYTRWYEWDRFPLVPKFTYRAEDRQNCADWCFEWMALTVWTMMSPDLGFSVEMDDQGIEARIRVPYLIIRFRLPLFPRAWYQKLWRVKRWDDR